MEDKLNLLDFDLNGLTRLVTKLGAKPYAAGQIMKWLHQKHVTSFDEMTNISKELRTLLQKCFGIAVPKIITYQKSQDGTHKWLLGLADGNAIETVLIPEKGRNTLCMSSQVGCPMGCSFCKTGKQGFNRNLTTAEIIGQLWLASREFNVTNIVFMGMGEPLLNTANVITAINIIFDDFAYGMSKHRVTISTVGILPELESLRAKTDAALAISLHAPNDKLRNQLLPANKKYSLIPLMEVCKSYFAREKRRSVMIEYVMLNGINNQPEHAKQLIKLLNGGRFKVNLIPFNSYSDSEYTASSEEQIDNFKNILTKAGINTITRKSRGEDIGAACGQLKGDFYDKTNKRS